jgi:hypothetical protein
MAQTHEQTPRWHIWVALLSGVATGYALLMGLFLGLS